MNILTVGSVAFDTIKTPFETRARVQGGSATFFSLAASYFAPVKLVSVVGEDFTGEHRRIFEGRSIDIAGLEARPGKTFHWSGEYHFDLNERTTHATELGVFADFEPKIPAAYREAEIVFLANIDPEIQLRVLDAVEHPSLVGLDTMNFWIESKREALARVLPRVDVLVVNDGEIRQLAGEANVLRAAAKVLAMGPGRLVVKRGEYGVLVFTKDTFFALPAFPVPDVQDPTGAGDTFAGGFFGFLARKGDFDEWSIRQAAVVGSAMASFCVQEFGPAALTKLNDDEIKERFLAFKRLTEFDSKI
jgi:sugar/nucleoside kinase (ribokinase family)